VRPRLVLATLAAAAAALGGGMLAGPASAAPAAGSAHAVISLDVSPTTITVGHDSAALLIGTAEGTNSGGTPTGTIEVEARQGGAIRHLCQVHLFPDVTPGNGAGGNCQMGDTSLFPGTQALFAHYNGDSHYAAGDSTPDVLITVNPAPTQPSLAQSDASPSFGQEHGDTMTVTVGPRLPGEFAPAGDFTVTANINGTPQQICSGTLPASVDADTNSGTCALTDTAVPVGSWPVTAHYAGGNPYASGDSDSATINVSKGQSTLALTLPAASLEVDKETGAMMSYSVGPQSSVLPTGTVSVAAVSTATGRATPVCSGPVTAGSCVMTAAELAPGSYMVTATYGGDTNYAGKATDPQPFTITKVPAPPKVATKTALTRPHLRVKFGHEQTDRLSVQVTARNGAKPAGKVTVKTGKVTLCTITLKGGKGSCALRAKRLHPGTYQLVASYPGSAKFTRSASGKVKLIVTK